MQELMLYRIRQSFPDQHIEDVYGAVKGEIQRMYNADSRLKPGMRVAITVGSRGIANLSQIIKAIVDSLKEAEIEPFIIPAMGSHGGASAAGQQAVLEHYGITEASMGVPVLSSMEVVRLPQGDLPCPLYQDRFASEADGIILVNRIKVHTDFHGTYESGLMKMAVIGLGKHEQAKAIHRFGANGLRDLVPLAARQIIRNSKILFGLGIVENAYDETLAVKAIEAELIPDEEPRLLELCRQNMPKLPVDNLDALIVDQLGKDISGTGLDTNIIGRIRINNEPEPAQPNINRLIVTDLSADTYGNATGMGLADFITRKMQDKIDFQATYENVITSSFVERGKMPMVADTDARAFEFAARTWGDIDVSEAAVVRIKDTLHLSTLYVSQKVYDQIKHRPDITLLDDAAPAFDDQGQLFPFQL